MKNQPLKLIFMVVVLAAIVIAAGIPSASAFDIEFRLRCQWFQQQSWKAARQAKEDPPGPGPRSD